MNDKLIIIKEHHTSDNKLDAQQIELLREILDSDDYNPDNPDRLLGIDWNNRARTDIKAKYYIGLKWIKEGNLAVYVHPKINNLDYMSMLMHCFNNDCKDVAGKLGKIYNIDLDRKPIKSESNIFELTPILIAHFLKLTQNIVQGGLKCNYIQREENLQSKIKGKILLGQTIKGNYAVGRKDHTVCRYQDYSIDCVENRILKKTLLFVNRFIQQNQGMCCRKDLMRLCSFCLGAMTSVSDDIHLQNIKQFKVNPLYREYAETLKVAKLILKRFSYNIDLVTKDADNLLPPFYIDMSLLFELYVYSQLKLAYKSDIHHHLRSFGNEIDFVKYREQLIIDAKYITKWKDSVLHDNIRQLSGYARNHSLREKIMKNQNNDTTILNCVIVYPNENGCQKFDPDNSFISNSHSPNSYEPIDSYLKFHRIAIKLPNKD